MDHIPARKAPIFRLQQRFRKRGPFLSFLAQHDLAVSIPGVSPVRWYSTNELFHRLLGLWDYMVAFARAERKNVPELNPNVRNDLDLLARLTDAFVAAQLILEGNAFAAGSHFIPHFLTIVDAIDRFIELEPHAVAQAHAYIDEFRADYAVEWQVFTIMTFLNPYCQWVVGRTCSEEEMRKIAYVLTGLVQARINDQDPIPVVAVAPRDFHTYIATGPVEMLPAADQVDRYLKRRTAGSSPGLAFWVRPPMEMTHLAAVALDFLALLATSASMERGFSVARHVASEWQMAILPENFSTRVLIQTNWDKAAAALLEILRLGRSQWKILEDERKRKKANEDNHWRMHLVHRPLDVTPVEDEYGETMDDSSEADDDEPS
jgi:hypothetical protein